MKRELEAELTRLVASRSKHADALRNIDLELGKVAGQALAKDEHVNKSSIARVIGVSRTHVGNLISSYEKAGPQPEAQNGIPIIQGSLAGDYIRDRDTRIIRSISAFSPSDTLSRSELDPRLFEDHGRAYVPHMLWQLEGGEWIGIDKVNVGYGGTGCSYAINALTSAGIDLEKARRIVNWRFCDARDIDDPSTWEESKIWPVEPRTTPGLIEDRMIVHCGEALSLIRDNAYVDPTRPDTDETGFYPSEREIPYVQGWIDFLNRPDVPDWAKGTRVARIFINPQEAETQGFILKGNPWGMSRWMSSSPTVVIEQGYVQIWGHFYRPKNRSQILPDEAYELLAAADVYPADLAEKDVRSSRPLGRFAATLFGTDRALPASLDVSHDGKSRLSFTPGLDAES